jgi:integrase/recombinase XerC
VHPDYVGKRVKAALGGTWTTHSCRHRFATRAYAGTHDLRAVQLLLGHSKPETTARYVAVAHDDLLAAVLAVA